MSAQTSGRRYHIPCDGKNIYLFIGVDGYHEATIPDENRPKNETERRHVDAIMRKLSEINGYTEPEE